MEFKVGEIFDVQLVDEKGKVIMQGEMYNPDSTPREIELAKRLKELEKIVGNLKV